MAPAKKRSTTVEEERPGERRQEILDVAADLFSTAGIVPTTVRDIARSVGILSGSLYHHFDSKETMVEEIVSPPIHRLIEANEAVIKESATTEETLERLVRTVIQAVTDEPKAWRILQNDFVYLESVPRFAYLNDLEAKITRMWTDVLRKGVDERVVRSDIPPDLLYRFIRDSVAMLPRWYRPNRRYSQSALEDTWVSLLSKAWAPA
jgi:AcrR family transcriptional regulator